MEGFTVLVTGPDQRDAEAVAREINGRLCARGIATELIDTRTPGVEALRGGEGAATFLAGVLARHGVTTVLALPAPSRAARDRARQVLGRLIEVHVPATDGIGAAGYEPPLRAEVEIAAPEMGCGTGPERVLRTLELLGFLEPEEGTAYSAEEEREVLKRLKAFGYL